MVVSKYLVPKYCYEMEKPKSTVEKITPKPVNVFYVWYSELCRRANITPAPFVKPAKPKSQTVLDFVADRLKLEEWRPIVNALRQDTSLHVISIKSRIRGCEFLHDIDTEDKAKQVKRKYGCIWTAYMLRQLLKSLSASVKITQVLTYLELNGLPLFTQYLEPFLQAIKTNSTIKTLSFSNCTIEDVGCQMVCVYLRFTPNIEVLNLSGCGLSAVSGEYIAKLIKYQQINRYCESWHNSLRYENPEAEMMRGLKRVTLNCNPLLGDEGVDYILNELEDDLWIKALDIQKCGVTERLAEKILDVIKYNRSLEIVDLRQNELLSNSTIENVVQLLHQRQPLQNPEFQWCNTALSLTWSCVPESVSKVSVPLSYSVRKSNSSPLKNATSKIGTTTCLRKTKTAEVIQKKPHNTCPSTVQQKQVMGLNNLLLKEIQKRKEIEKRNETLQKRLDRIKNTTQVNLLHDMKSKTTNGIKEVNGVTKAVVAKVSKVQKAHTNGLKKTGTNVVVCTEEKSISETRNGCITKQVQNGYKNGFKNGFLPNGQKSNAFYIFEKLVNKSQDVLQGDHEDKQMMGYLNEDHNFEEIYEKTDQFINCDGGSQASLYKYMQELKNNST